MPACFSAVGTTKFETEIRTDRLTAVSRETLRTASMNRSKPDVALVTGASSGIGLATAKALLNAGYRVFGTSRRANYENVDGITMVPCDVTDETSVAKLVETVLKEAGSIDVLVNNAGIGLLAGAEESSIAQAHALFDVNVFGVIRVTNAVLPVMRKQKSGRIINMSSVLGLIPSPYNALYASTKHAIEGYSESLDHEIRTFGVRVVLIEPAYTRSAFEENVLKPDQPIGLYEPMRFTMSEHLRDQIAVGDTPETVATTVVAAATASSPKRRYTAGKLAGKIRLLRRLVPEAAFDKSLRKQSGLPV
ncbi:NAD(P)-dependent dehydrogenase (short-subunit alcohol dehydrogenase family) [Ochrobactrum sp. RH2CCR150]|nr:NAD(P)-dependent dehydrogenase (short-subunit alcohol dehydrogenase family) [Ochrobactrum sp. RH2CCR150]